MHSVFTSLRTITLYGVARIRYLAATPAVWRGIGLLALAVLAATGTYAAWRTRTAPSETAVVADLGLEAGLAPEAAASQEPDNAAATAVTPAAVTPGEPFGVRDDTMNPFTGQSLAEERTSRVWEQRLAAVQHELEVARTQVQIAEQHKELARLRRETQAMTHPPRAPAPPPVPRVAVLVREGEDPARRFHRLCDGLVTTPLLPHWALWLWRWAQQHESVRELHGIGCRAWLGRLDETQLEQALTKALQTGILTIPVPTVQDT